MLISHTCQSTHTHSAQALLMRIAHTDRMFDGAATTTTSDLKCTFTVIIAVCSQTFCMLGLFQERKKNNSKAFQLIFVSLFFFC